jgi:hypothetical protein
MPEAHRHPEQQAEVRRDGDDDRNDPFQIEGGHVGFFVDSDLKLMRMVFIISKFFV